MRLSMEEIYRLAREAGFPPSTATQMTAIAWRESGGDTQAFNGKPPDESYGLWQINMLGNLGLQRMAQFGLTSKAQLFNPVINARAAYAIWGGNDRNLSIAWAIDLPGIYQDRYQQNLPQAEAAAMLVEGSPNPTQAPASLSRAPEPTGAAPSRLRPTSSQAWISGSPSAASPAPRRPWWSELGRWLLSWFSPRK